MIWLPGTKILHSTLLLASLGALHAAEMIATPDIDRETLDQWSAPYRGWHYQPDHVIPAEPNIPGHEKFHNTDCPCVYQLPGQPDKWYMSFIAFNGQGYNSFVAESTDLVGWSNPRLAMGFGPTNEFDAGGCVIGAFLYESYAIKAPRLLKQRDGKYWTLYGCYPRQGGYELRPGYEGVACSQDGLTWQRAKHTPILAVQDADCAAWEKDCIYQPWLVEHRSRFLNFYNAADGGTEQTGLAFSTDLLNWLRYPANPVIHNRPDGYDAQFASDPKVFRDGDHWTMFYFGVGHDGAHIMAAFSRDLVHWAAHPEPLYKAGGNPTGLDKQYAHKISLIFNPNNETFYLYYCACGTKGRGIGLITSKPLPLAASASGDTGKMTWEGETQDTWHGYKRHVFKINGLIGWVVEPKQPLPGNPWSWCLEYPDAFTERCTAPALLEKGFFHAYIAVGNTFGCPSAVRSFNAFYDDLISKGLSRKPVLIGISRGGLYSYRWASENPGKVAAIYGDAPVCDFKSWPAGKGKGDGSKGDWAALLKCYKFKSEAEALAYPGNPIDVLKPLAEAKVPLIHVVGDTDTVVPVAENTAIVEERYKALGGTIVVIHKPGVGHHPHGLDDPTPVVDFLLKAVAAGTTPNPAPN